jgi:hypothetical protein
MVWIDREQSGKVDELVDELVERINGYEDIQLRQAIVAKLAERLFGTQILGHNTIELADRSGGGNVGKGNKTHSRSFRREG